MAGAGLLGRFSNFNRTKEALIHLSMEIEAPFLPTKYAVVAALCYTVLYVGVLYLNPSTRPSADRSRDNPAVMKDRMRMVCISCAISAFSTYLILSRFTEMDFWHCLRLMGLWPVQVPDVSKALGLTVVLFAAPLAETIFLDGSLKGVYEGVITSLISLTGWRNFVVAPITEELTFRSCIIAVHLATPSPSLVTLVLLTPLYFGVAHFHHFYEFVLSNPTKIGIGVIRSVVQFTYTTLFGWYAAFLYVRLGSLWAAILVHSLCNSIGVPRFYGMIDESPPKTLLYYVLLVGGAVNFWKFLWPWTESPNGLKSFV